MIKIIAFLMLLIMTGCSAVFNPYESEYRCKGRGNDGKCLSTGEAYKESLGDSSGNNSSGVDYNNDKKEVVEGKKDKDAVSPTPSPQAVYDKNRYGLMTELVNEAKPPIVVPPDIVRVLILPYVDSSNNMNSSKFVFYFAKEPQWQFTTGEESEDN